MEENDLDPITRYKNLVLRLQDKISVWNGEFVATLDCTNNDISVFLSELGEAHIAEIAIWLDLKFHQGYPTIGKMLHREGIWEVNDIGNITSCQQFRIDNQGEAQDIFFLEVGIGIFRIPHSNDGLFGSHFFSQNSGDHVHFIVLGHSNEDITVFNIRLLQDLEVRPIP